MPDLTKKQKEKAIERLISQINWLTKTVKALDEQVANANKAQVKHIMMLATLLGTLKKKGVITDEDLTTTFHDLNKERGSATGVQSSGTGSDAGSGGDVPPVPGATVETPAGGVGVCDKPGITG